MLIAAQVTGISTIYIYLRDEYAGIRALLTEELAALGADPPCPIPPIELRRGAGAYICGLGQAAPNPLRSVLTGFGSAWLGPIAARGRSSPKCAEPCRASLASPGSTCNGKVQSPTLARATTTRARASSSPSGSPTPPWTRRPRYRNSSSARCGWRRSGRDASWNISREAAKHAKELIKMSLRRPTPLPSRFVVVVEIEIKRAMSGRILSHSWLLCPSLFHIDTIPSTENDPTPCAMRR